MGAQECFLKETKVDGGVIATACFMRAVEEHQRIWQARNQSVFCFAGMSLIVDALVCMIGFRLAGAAWYERLVGT